MIFQLQFEYRMSQNLSSQHLNPQRPMNPLSEIEIKLESTEFQSKRQSSPPAVTFSCKICLSEIEIAQKQKEGLISPCLCTGSVKYVHEKCLVEWLNTIIKRNLQNGQNTPHIFCEICKYSYDYETEQKLACCEKWEIKEKMKLNWGIFALGIFFLLFSVGAIMGLGIVIGQKILKLTGSQEAIMVYVVMGILLVVIAIWVRRMLIEFFLKTMYFIKGIKQKKQGNEQNQSVYVSNFEISNNAMNPN